MGFDVEVARITASGSIYQKSVGVGRKLAAKAAAPPMVADGEISLGVLKRTPWGFQGWWWFLEMASYSPEIGERSWRLGLSRQKTEGEGRSSSDGSDHGMLATEVALWWLCDGSLGVCGDGVWVWYWREREGEGDDDEMKMMMSEGCFLFFFLFF